MREKKQFDAAKWHHIYCRAHKSELISEAFDLRKLNHQMLEALEDMEWLRRPSLLDHSDVDYFCPCCGARRDDGHHKECRLAAAIAAAKGE